MIHATFLLILPWVMAKNINSYDAPKERSTRQVKDVRDDAFVFYNGIDRIYLEVFTNTTSGETIDCDIYSNRLLAARKLAVKTGNALLTEEFISKIATCENVTGAAIKWRLRVSRDNLYISPSFLKVLGNRAYSTYPGTKWCGTGTLALNSNDLGSLKNVDECCNTHAHCSESLLPGESKDGLQNHDFYARRHCRCDVQLFRCLKNLIPDEDADLVGHMYFNVLQIECFEYDFPRTCASYDEDGFCRTYKYPKYAEGKASYQWFSNPTFKREKSDIEIPLGQPPK